MKTSSPATYFEKEGASSIRSLVAGAVHKKREGESSKDWTFFCLCFMLSSSEIHFFIIRYWVRLGTILCFIVAVQREKSINQASKPSKIVSGVVAVGVGDWKLAPDSRVRTRIESIESQRSIHLYRSRIGKGVNAVDLWKTIWIKSFIRLEIGCVETAIIAFGFFPQPVAPVWKRSSLETSHFWGIKLSRNLHSGSTYRIGEFRLSKDSLLLA